jgi:hypothetical protein
VALHPFTARSYGIPGYDERVTDDSEEGEAACRARVRAFLAEARSLEKAKPDFAGETVLARAPGRTHRWV